jgi:quinoprotein glucose dehydrogenase
MIPCTKPPWATLVGVDLAAGEIRWTVPLGNISRSSPLPLPLDWGAPISGGPIATAGGLTFIGATGDARLRAFETATGKEVWSTPLPASAHASPMTYLADGRQYVVIAAGGHMFINAAGIDDQLVAFAIPPSPAGSEAPSPGEATTPR